MTETLLALVLSASALSSFPADAGGRISQPAVLVPAPGGPLVVVPAGDQVAGFRANGAMAPGFPFSLGGGESASGPVAAADMDGDGRPEIAVVTSSGQLFLWSGAVLPGFPVSLGTRAKAGPSFADADGDGRPEVMVGDEKGRVHAFERTGAAAKGWPASVGRPVTSSVSSSTFAGGRSFAVGCEDGRVHVLDEAGKERRGFPLVTHFSVSGAPAFADLDDDGAMDLVVASQDFSAYAVSARGEPLPGFPVAAAYRLYDGPAVADLDGDGALDVVFASADGLVHAVSAQGVRLRGFPARAGGRLFGGASVGDLDRDGRLDVAVAAADGSVFAFDAAGRPLAGFPASLDAAEVAASPLLADVTGDGTLAIFVGLPTGALHALRAPSPGTAGAAAPWPSSGRDAARTGRYGPNPPAYKDVALRPAVARVTDALQASWRGIWLDAAPGEGAPGPRIEWLRDGKPVPALEGKRELPPGTARRGETWRFVLSTPTARSTFASPELRIADSAPGAAVVAIEPEAPLRAGPARAIVRKPAPDADADALTYRTEWLQDGLETGVVGDAFPGDRMRKGALLTARVVASDGELAGPAAAAQARVADTAPGPMAVALEPLTPAQTDVVRARVQSPASDVDGDPLAYRYRWTVDGERRNLPLSAAELPASLFRKHQRIEVEARAFDGRLEGPAASAATVARNTPPTAATVRILPDRPRKGATLRAVLAAPAEDADRDAIAYRFTWRKNGQPWPLAGDAREVPSADVARGDRFEVTVVASDGEVEGPRASASVTIANTAPVAPRIAIEPARPRGGDALKLVQLEPGKDADGDEVRLGIAWTRNGKPTGTGGRDLVGAEYRKHERVRVVVTPKDLDDAGEPVAFEVAVDDAPPTAPEVALGPARPTVTEPLKALIRTKATDADGDRLTYRYRWLKDGVPVALPDPAAGSKGPPYWTAASEVPTSQLGRGQRWTVEVQAGDGELFGPVARATAVVQNAAPPAPRVSFSPERPRRTDGIAAVLQQPADPDGDPVTYRYAWWRNGERVEAPADAAQIARNVARKGQRWAVEVVASDGELESAPVRAEVVVADATPGPTSVALCDQPVPAGTVLEARLGPASSDADGDPVTYRHEWLVNGKPVAVAAGQARLAAPALRKHDVVRVVVTPFDGELAGPAAAAECLVVNTPPGAPSVALEPAEPTAPTGVTVAVRKPSGDHDGDDLTYRYLWKRDGLPTEHEGPAIPSGVMRHGETWQVEVTPFDGEEPGERVVLAVGVKNTPPPTPSVVLSPAAIAVGEGIGCDVSVPAHDADREPVVVKTRWLKDGRVEAIADGATALPAGVARRGERWRCEAWSTDGTAESARASAELVVRNSPPPAPRVAMEPERPRRDDDLVCRVATASVDPDGDGVSYTYAWWRNERPMPSGADPTRVESSRVAKGEKWRCAATPSDGTVAGGPASADRTIANSPPGPARVRIAPAPPRGNEALRCEVVGASEDADGDAVRYRFVWERNGAPQPFAETSAEVPARLVKGGDRWRCVVTPTDGSEDGPRTGSEEILVPFDPASEPTASLSLSGGPGMGLPR